MISEIAMTAGGVLPFYLGLLAIATRQFEARFFRLFLLFILSGLSTLPFFGLQWFGIDQSLLSSLYGPLFSIVLLAFAEELSKSIALLFDKEPKKHYYYPFIIGIGFAFFENISYLLGFDFTVGFLIIAVMRLFMGSTAHAVFTTLVSHFLNKGLHKTKGFYYLLGLLVAGSFHSLFNLLHHWEMSYLTIPLLVVLIVYLHFDHGFFSQAKKLGHHMKTSHARSSG
jgi:hypothetical protein